MKNFKLLHFTITGFILTSVLIFFNSCEFSVSTANIKSADLAKEIPGGKTQKVGSVFHPNDGPFHLLVTVANAPDSTKVKAAWFAVNVAGEKNSLIDQNQFTLGKNTEVDFNLSLPHPWPAGKYKVDLFLNGKLDRSIPFDVKE